MWVSRSRWPDRDQPSALFHNHHSASWAVWSCDLHCLVMLFGLRMSKWGPDESTLQRVWKCTEMLFVCMVNCCGPSWSQKVHDYPWLMGREPLKLDGFWTRIVIWRVTPWHVKICQVARYPLALCGSWGAAGFSLEPTTRHDQAMRQG